MKNTKAKNIIGIISHAAIGLLLNFFLLCMIFCLDKSNTEFSNSISVLLIFLSGLCIVFPHILFSLINRKLKLYDELSCMLIMSAGTAAYIILLIFLFPAVLSLDFMYVLLPSGELAADYTVLLIQLFSAVTAAVCIVIDLIILFIKKRMKAENR